MENQRTYNLRGLLLVFWGMLLEFLICGIGGAVSSVVSNTMGEGISSGNLATVILVIAVLVFTLMIIAGLSRVKSYSDKFRKARNYYIWNILLALLAGAVVFVGAFLILGSMDDNGNTSFFAVVDKSLSAQKERIEKQAKQKTADRKENQAKAAKERLEKAGEERKTGVTGGNKAEASDRSNVETISASSVEELAKKLQDRYYEGLSDLVRTEQEQKMGTQIDFKL